MPQDTTVAGVEALFFDVFGTLLDWRTSIARESEKVLRPLGYNLDWIAFADAWRGEYQPGMEEVRTGRIPFSKLDVLHRRNLERCLPRFGVSGLSEDVMVDLNNAWHRLDAWPDVPVALARLKKKHIIAPCSNGNIALMVNMAKRAGLPRDAILGAEVARSYKPQPQAYLATADCLGLQPGECVLVAAHNSDLVAAGKCGLQRAFVARPTEHGPGQKFDLVAKHDFEYVAKDFVDLADKLGC
jgi:2-haloacid dehalogenase